MSLYITGTVNTTNGSNAVIGVGTAFLANVSAGDGFLISGETVYYTVLSVTDDTHLTLSVNYAGPTGSGKGYQISRDWTVNLGLAEIQPGDPNWPYLLAQAVIRILDTLIATGHKIPANLAWELKNAVGTTRLKVDEASGNVGIGTTAPGATLEVYGNSPTMKLMQNPNIPGNVSFTLSAAGANNTATINIAGGAIQSNTGIGNGLLLNPSGGNVGIGLVNPSYQFHLSTDSAAKPSTNTWTVASDERLKKDIVLANIDRCYDIVKALPLKRYTWKDEIYTPEQVADRSKLGWIAQDVETIFPKAVGLHDFRYNQQYETITEPVLDEQGNPILDEEGNPKHNNRKQLISEDVIEDCRSLNSDQIIAVLYGAVQQLQAKVEALETHLKEEQCR